ncbi:DUF2752 domain-containing protein [Nonlabens sp. Asnod2-A12]|uniref:DUF2752 domain-containing protein n=1 Tax=Nonlabens sp. Asnod2-A12 TaxID=3160578 RepID=UPI003863CEF5
MIKNYKQILIICGAIILFGTAFFLFKNYNPEQVGFYPQCPSKYVTGYDCPGCGSQRAVHSLLNGDFKKAFNYNPLLFVLLPFGFLVGVFEWIPSLRDHKFRRWIINRYLVLFVFAAVILFTVIRNL